MTYDLDFQSQASYGQFVMIHIQEKIKVKGQLVQKIEWKQTDRRT